MNLSGNMTRQVESDLAVEIDVSHVANIGRLVEDMELKMRNLLRKTSSPRLLAASRHVRC
jgi:capping protein (actin filament) muscle Z-line, beta